MPVVEKPTSKLPKVIKDAQNRFAIFGLSCFSHHKILVLKSCYMNSFKIPSSYRHSLETALFSFWHAKSMPQTLVDPLEPPKHKTGFPILVLHNLDLRQYSGESGGLTQFLHNFSYKICLGNLLNKTSTNSKAIPTVGIIIKFITEKA